MTRIPVEPSQPAVEPQPAAPLPDPVQGGEPQATPEPGPAPAPAPEPTVEPTPEPAPAPQPAPDPLDAALDRAGFDRTGYDSPVAYLDHLKQRDALAGQVPQMQQLVEYANAILGDPEAAKLIDQHFSAGAPGAIPEPAASEEQPYWPAPPDWTPAMEQRLGRDPETNELTGAPADLAKYNAHQDYRQERVQALIDDPYACVEPKVMEALKAQEQQTRQIIQEEIATYRSQQSVDAFAIDNQDWLYQKDAQGRPMIDPNTQHPVPTAEGLTFSNACDELAAAGVPHDQIIGMAQRLTFGPNGGPDAAAAAAAPAPGTPGPSPQATPTPAPTPADLYKQRFIEPVLRAANRGNSVAAAADPHGPAQNPDEDARTMLTRGMAQAGYTADKFID